MLCNMKGWVTYFGLPSTACISSAQRAIRNAHVGRVGAVGIWQVTSGNGGCRVGWVHWVCMQAKLVSLFIGKLPSCTARGVYFPAKGLASVEKQTKKLHELPFDVHPEKESIVAPNWSCGVLSSMVRRSFGSAKHLQSLYPAVTRRVFPFTGPLHASAGHWSFRSVGPFNTAEL